MNRAERRAAAREEAQNDGKVFHAGRAMTVHEKRARVIAGLYNNSKPLGMGIIHYIPGKMSVEEAFELAKGQANFDYYRGRVIKCSLDKNGELLGSSEFLYDRDNGEGACKRAVENGLADSFYDRLAELCSSPDADA